MKQTFAAIVLAAGLTLGSCAGLNPTTVSSITTTFITQVERAAVAICRAVPEVAAIEKLVNAGIGLSVSGIAAAFCSAFVAAVPVAPQSAAPVIVTAGRRFRAGAGGPVYACAGSICGWKL